MGLAVLLVFLLACPGMAYAADRVDLNRECSVLVKVGKPDVSVNLYRVGDVKRNGTAVLVKEYKKYAVSLENLGTSSSAEAAEALETFFIRDDVQPLKTAKTNAQGNVLFDGLETGVYLVSCPAVREDNGIRVFSPMLFSLPTNFNGQWYYDLTSDMKEEIRQLYTYCRVYKVWESDSAFDFHPRKITVQLLRDGKVYDEQELSAANSWRYTWYELEEGPLWTVIEKEVPDGYTLGVENDGSIYVLTNTEDKPDIPDTPDKPDEPDEPETPDTPDDPDTPDKPDESDEPDEPDEPDGPDKPDKPDKPDSPEEEKLPQTGQLWWPVSMLAAAGLAFLLIGMLLCRTEG